MRIPPKCLLNETLCHQASYQHVICTPMTYTVSSVSISYCFPCRSCPRSWYFHTSVCSLQLVLRSFQNPRLPLPVAFYTSDFFPWMLGQISTLSHLSQFSSLGLRPRPLLSPVSCDSHLLLLVIHKTVMSSDIILAGSWLNKASSCCYC